MSKAVLLTSVDLFIPQICVPDTNLHYEETYRTLWKCLEGAMSVNKKKITPMNYKPRSML